MASPYPSLRHSSHHLLSVVLFVVLVLRFLAVRLREYLAAFAMPQWHLATVVQSLAHPSVDDLLLPFLHRASVPFGSTSRSVSATTLSSHPLPLSLGTKSTYLSTSPR